jgi:diaminohydroxyphosphoribosylaminopyrimidine deaminase/5-amino-6-(5-phosphoribosylamino)uracil reductase
MAGDGDKFGSDRARREWRIRASHDPSLTSQETALTSEVVRSADADTRFMTRALELARLGEGLTSPNPMVGCVLVKDGKIVGEGWHRGAGLPHAEPVALIAAGDRTRGATAYVTLEPCSHHGRTPPCTEALLKAGVREVVYALADPHPVAAGGATRLQASGLKVRAGVLESEARDLNRAWLHTLKRNRPYVIAKTAMSLDGRIATREGDSKWITSLASREEGHKLRRMADAIIVGAETVIADDPALTARIEGEIRAPLRVVLDSKGRTSPGAMAFDRSGKGAILATTAAATPSRLERFRKHGVDALVLPADEKGRPHVDELLEALRARGVVTALVEGGGEITGGFLDADLIDEVWLFIAPILIGGGKSAFAGEGASRLADIRTFDFDAPIMLGLDLLMRGVRRRGEA